MLLKEYASIQLVQESFFSTRLYLSSLRVNHVQVDLQSPKYLELRKKEKKLNKSIQKILTRGEINFLNEKTYFLIHKPYKKFPAN